MVNYYKTIDGFICPVDTCEPGCWVNCIDPDAEEVNRLIEEFAVDPDFFRAALDEEESSHLDTEDGNTLVILDIPCVELDDEHLTYFTRPLGIIITEKNVITVSLHENPILDEFAEGLVKNVKTNLKTHFTLHLMLRIASRYLQYLKQIDRTTSMIEKELRRSMKNSELLQLMDMEKSLVYFSSSLKSNELTLEKIMRGRVVKLYEEDQDLLEDVLIEIKQAVDMSGIYLDILSSTMESFASLISNNLNMVMKVLASITLIISIPTVISGYYGMNVDGIPAPQFWFPIAVSVVVMALAAFILRKKQML